MKTQKLKPIACVLAVSIFLAGCNGGRSTADGSSNSLQAAQAIVNNNDANHAAFIERVKKAQQGPANYEVLNRDFYTERTVPLAFDPAVVKSAQLTSSKSLTGLGSDTEIGLMALSGGVGLIPGVGPFLSFAVDTWGQDVIDAYTTQDNEAYDPNTIGRQLAKLQNKVALMEQDMLKNNNAFYKAIKQQSANSVNSAQSKLFTAMQQVSFGANLSAGANSDSCALSSGDLAFHYFGYSGLGMDEFGSSCNPTDELDFMGIAKDLSEYASDLNMSISDRQAFVSALTNVSGALTPAGYNGDFSTIAPVSGANQSVLLQVLDSMYLDLQNAAPKQGTAAGNYVDTIAQYDQSLLFILQSAYNALQGAYAIEHTNNYLNFLAAVNALQTNSKGSIPQINGYEGMQSVNFSITASKLTNLKDLEADYVNKQNNLLMLYTARTNVMFNTVMKYMVSDKPLTSSNLPAIPTTYKIGNTSYNYEVPLRAYSQMYPSPHPVSDLSNLPQGNWTESTVLYSWNGYSNYYACSDAFGGSVSEKNCALYPKQESGFYDGDKFFVQVKPPTSSPKLPASSKNLASIPTDWYVGSQRLMPFKLSTCENPSTATVNLNKPNASLVCGSYSKWEPVGLATNIADVLMNNKAKSSIETEMAGLREDKNSPFVMNTLFGATWMAHQYGASEFSSGNSRFADNNNEFLLDAYQGFSNSYMGLITDSLSGQLGDFRSQFMLLGYIDADAVGLGGSMKFAMSCPGDVNGDSNYILYNYGKPIQPSYLTCHALSASNADDMHVYGDNIEHLDTSSTSSVGYYPAMVTYDGSDSFTLYRIRLAWLDTNSEAGLNTLTIDARRIACSSYSGICK